MTEHRLTWPALPSARQAWPPPYSQDAADRLEAMLPVDSDEANEILLAHLPSPAPAAGAAA